MKYRAEIDGLRALAVVPVILFHAGFELFSGGFVGVDVFFVISGYLITYILIDEIENNRFSLVNFYERRARRILPALFFIMLICIPFAWIWMLPSQFTAFAQSLIAVSLFASNILFWRESGYFAATSEEKPLLHTWSLAVEEQYYLLFPIFLIFTWRFGKNSVFWMIAIMAAISLLLTEWGWRNHPTANFYLAPSRAWELLSGSIAAFIVRNRGIQSNNSLSIIGLAAIIFSIFFYDEATPFPSFYTLVPVLGAVLLILFSDKETLAAKILGYKLLVGIGLISYSAYLWHQPLFAFARIRSLGAESPYVMFLLSVASIILAAASYKFIEQPFRKSRYLGRLFIFNFSIFSFSFLILCGFILVAYSPKFEEKFVGNLDKKQYTIYEKLQYSTDRDSAWRHGECFLTEGTNFVDYFDVDLCLSVSDVKKNVLLLGDSHSAHWYPGLVENYPHINFLQANASGCRPLIYSRGEKRCTDLYNYIFNTFNNWKKIDAVIIAAQWDVEEARAALADTLVTFKSLSRKVYLLGNVPEYEDDLPRIILRNYMYKSETLTNHTNSYLVAERFTASRAIEDIARSEGVTYISVIDLICPNARCEPVTSDGVPMAFDYGHLTLEASSYLVNKMMLETTFLDF